MPLEKGAKEAGRFFWHLISQTPITSDYGKTDRLIHWCICRVSNCKKQDTNVKFKYKQQIQTNKKNTSFLV